MGHFRHRAPCDHVCCRPRTPIDTRAFKIPTGGEPEPTLRGRSRGTGQTKSLLIALAISFSPPARGDLVAVFRTTASPLPAEPSGQIRLFQRLVGLPERIEIREGRVFADARRLTERGASRGVTYTIPPARSSTTRAGVCDAERLWQQPLTPRYWGSWPKANIYGRRVTDFPIHFLVQAFRDNKPEPCDYLISMQIDNLPVVASGRIRSCNRRNRVASNLTSSRRRRPLFV